MANQSNNVAVIISGIPTTIGASDTITVAGGLIGTPVGATSATTGAFTTLAASSTSTLAAVNASGLVAAAGAVTVGTTLGVTGTSTMAAINASGTVAAAGAVTVGTTLGVTGTSTMAAINASGTVAAAGAVTVGTTLGVTGTSTMAAINASGTVAAAGAVTVGTTLGVTGTSTMAAINASGLVAAAGAVTVGTTLGVTGNATFSADVDITGDLTVTGDIISKGSQNLVVQDPMIDLGLGNTTTTATAGGLSLTMNRAAAFVASSATTFVAGVVATSAPTITVADIVSSTLFVAGDVVCITTSTSGVDNDGLYVVNTVNQAAFPQILTLYGVGGTAVPGALPFAQNQVEAASGQTVISAFKVDLAVQVFADGTTAFKDINGTAYAKGTLTSAYKASATKALFETNGAYLPSSGTLQNAYNSGATITTAGAVDIAFTLTSGNFVVNAGTVDLGSSGADLTALNIGTGTMTVAATSAVAINSTAGAINIGNIADAQAINVGTGAAARTIIVGNVTGATGITLNSGTGGVAINTTSTGDVVVTSADSVLIDSANALELNSSAGVIGIGNDAVAQAINIGTGAAARTITIGNAASTAVNLNALAMTLTSVNALALTDGSATFQLAGTGATSLAGATTVDLDCSGAFSINSSAGALNLGDDAVAQAINVGTGAAARTITVGSSSSTAVNLNALAMTLTSVNALALTDGSATFQLGGTGATSLAGATTVDLDCSGTFSINSSAGVLNIGDDAIAQNISIGTGAAARTIAIGNITGTTAVNLNAGSGGIALTSTDSTIGLISGTGAINIGADAAAHTVTIGNGTGATSVVINSGTGAINVGTNAFAHTVTIGNVTGATAVAINSGTGGIAAATTGAGTYTVTSASSVLIDSSGVLELNSSAGVIGIGNDAVAQAINIGTGAAARTITIGNGTTATSLVLNIPAANALGFKIAQGANNYIVADTLAGKEAVHLSRFVEVADSGGVIINAGDTTLLQGEVLYVAADTTTTATKGRAGRAVATTSLGKYNAVGTAYTAPATALDSPVQVSSGHGMRVPVKFSAAPANTLNGSVVYLSTTAGLGTTTAPSASGDTVFRLGYLIGADGSDATPDVIWAPQFIANIA